MSFLHLHASCLTGLFDCNSRYLGLLELQDAPKKIDALQELTEKVEKASDKIMLDCEDVWKDKFDGTEAKSVPCYVAVLCRSSIISA